MEFESSHDPSISLIRFPAHIAEDPDLRRKYREMAEEVRQLQHPHILQIQELLEEDCLVVEAIKGAHPLTDIPSEPLVVARELISALQYAHAQGIPHRLFNCHCLWLFPGNTVKVWGFGLDYLEERFGPANRHESSATSPYWSPEHCLHQETEERSDIWALGVVLYRWSTGRLPFSSNSLPVLVDRILHYHPPEPGGPLNDLVLRCLEKDPSNRFQKMQELSSYLSY